MMGTRKKYEYSEQSIQAGLRSLMPSAEFFLCNMFVFTWESDVLILTKSRYWYEIEIKISRADFHNDLKHKSKKFECISDEENHHKPNYFYYAVPEGLISPDEVPPYSGLIYMSRSQPVIVKQAPKLHKEKMNTERMGMPLAMKFYHHMVDSKLRLMKAEKKIASLEKPYRKGYSEVKLD